MQGLAVAPRSQTADRRGDNKYTPLKFRSYWTEVSQSFTQCSQITTDETFEIGIAILYSV